MASRRRISKGSTATPSNCFSEIPLVDGSIQLVGNRMPLRVQHNVIDGDVQVFDNTGGVVIRHNHISHGRICFVHLLFTMVG